MLSKLLPLLGLTVGQQQPLGAYSAPATGGMAMDPLMMMLLLKDDKDSSKDNDNLLLMMMMMGGMGGQGGMGGMDPMMMYFLLKDDKDSSSSSKDNDNMLLMMMMMGGMGGQGMGGDMGGMNPLMLMLMLDDDDDCKIKNTPSFTVASGKTFTIDDAFKKAVAKGEKFVLDNSAVEDAVVKTIDNMSGLTDAQVKNALANLDFDYIKCNSGSDSMSDLLPLMMLGGGMGGQQGGMGGMGGMDPMMMMLLLGDDSSSDNNDMLMMMMLMGGMGGQGGMGGMGGMNPMMMILLLDDNDCGKYKMSYGFKVEADGSNKKVTKVTSQSDIEAIFKTTTDSATNYPSGTFYTDYKKCLDDKGSSSNSMSDLLPLMMLGGMGGQGQPMFGQQ